MRVVVTRAAEGLDRLTGRLQAAGLDVVECPLVRIEPLPLELVALDGYDWAVLTSARAVELLLDAVDGPLPPLAVIGPGTAEAARQRGIEPALVAADSTQEGLVAALRPRLEPGDRVLFAGAESARDVIERELDADVLWLYRTVPERPDVFPDGDLVVLASSSAARALASLGVDLPCVTIGPVTSTEARRVGLRVVSEAASHDLDGLVEAVRVAVSKLAAGRR
jgi:uroporphyrinogen-III synthase/uroporphyrinogen III methyltransferase/synthase